MLGRLLRKFLLALLPAAGLAPGAFAVSAQKPPRLPFFYDITSFTTTLSLPVTDTVETVKMDAAQLRERLDKAATDDTVEPLTLLLNDNATAIAQMAEKLSLQDSEEEFAEYLRKQLRHVKPTKDAAAGKTITITSKGFDLMDKEAFSDLYARTHHKLTLSTSDLRKDRSLRQEFMKQVSLYLAKDERKALLAKIAKNEAIDVDSQLLPDFAKQMVGKYVIYRGPNCFHAALAFQSPVLTSSSMINVKQESGYHRAMINYDELWRALGSGFYEVNPDKVPLKYGDMLVLFDVPADAENDVDVPVDFRWIRHTATYLFGGYTFSKGSKSPNTPYTVRTVADEWKTWKKYTNNLGLKVFRRSQKHVKSTPPVELADWIY